MAQLLMLDALFPPAPDALVADMRAVGARAVAAYLKREDASGGMLNTGSWTTAHFFAVQSAGMFVLPIFVPGSSPHPNDMPLAIQAATSAGVAKSAMVVDIEQFSFPAPTWLADAIKYAHGQGWRVIRYGDVSPLSNYPVADGDWISHGKIPVRAGQLMPIPALPDGVVADQYAVQCNIGAGQYDASVIDASVFSATSATFMEDTQVAGSMVRAPYDPNRLDLVWADPDGFLRVKTSTGGAGGMDSSDEAAIIDGEHTPAGGFYHVMAMWDNLNRLCYVGFANDGGIYLAVQRLDGVFDQGWSRLQNAATAVPQHPAPVVQPAPDEALRNALKQALGTL